jgi:hypothetical protein
MKSVLITLRRAWLDLRAEEITFARRGFRGASDSTRMRLEEVGAAFRAGYNMALEHGGDESLAPALNRVALERRGFAYEGAAMGLALLDFLTPWHPPRLRDFLRGPGEPHTYLVHVGAGWIWARWPSSARRMRPILEPVLSWLGYDGWGFHDGFFHWPQMIAGKPPPKSLSPDEKRVFDQGLGRSFWFVNGGNPALISTVIQGFPTERQPDLWSGLGLGATYAGMIDEAGLQSLRSHAGPFWPHLAQGATFAAKARQRAGNLTDYTDLATRILCGMPALEAAQVADDCLEQLPSDAAVPAYQIWRRRIQSHFRNQKPQLIIN